MAMTLITTNTESGDATSSFTSSIDSTYKLYVFKFYAVNPATDNTSLYITASTDGGSNYGVTATTTHFISHHNEADSEAAVTYATGDDLAQSTNPVHLTIAEIGNLADENAAGEFFLFNPSNTTYVKHFYGRANITLGSPGSCDNFSAGYWNTTSAINAVQFKMSSGNMDGVIKMYGVG